MTKPIDVSDSDFETQVIESESPVLVDFWAEWCGPCKTVAPVLEELAEEYNGQIKFTKVDIDANPETAVHYGIRSIPTLLVFKEGKPVDQIVGAVPRAEIKKRLDNALG
jgi:thioredoxin 1